MKTFIDQRLACEVQRLKGLMDPSSDTLVLSYAALFEYLDLGSLFESFPKLDEDHKLFSLFKTILESDQKNDLLIHFYDQLFTECLTYVKALPQMDPAFLIEQIQKKKDPSLDLYEQALTNNPYPIIHGLILHLAWDRMCVYIASLFDRDFSDLRILKECLVESFDHITAQGKTVPGLFRFIEALYSYYLKKENLQIHTSEEWEILSKGSAILEPRETFVSVPYMDGVNAECRKVLTLDSLDKVKIGMALATVIFEKLKKEDPNWAYTLSPAQVFCLKKDGNGFKIESTLTLPI